MALKKKKITKKKAAKKTSRKKVKAKKTTTKKSAAKKKTTKKTKAKKTTTKKAAVKKSSIKKAASKKRTKKKTTSKKKTTLKVSTESAKKAKTKGKKKKATRKERKETLEMSLSVEEYSSDKLRDILSSLKEIDFFVSESDECIESGCDNPATTGGYCRSDYIKNWKEIKRKEALIKNGVFFDHIKALVQKNPHLLSAILSDFNDDKTFHSVLKEMNIDASEDSFDDIDDDNAIDADVSYEKKSVNRSLYNE